jgi:hypothetical protein
MVSSPALAALVALCCASSALPQSKEKGDKEDDRIAKVMSTYAEQGAGVVDYKTDKRGRLTQVVVVGDARISTVLGATEGLDNARSEARLKAAGKFRQWLTEHVRIYEGTQKETLLVLEGKEGEKDSLQESGKQIKKGTQKFESCAAGTVRGLTLLHREVQSPNKKEKVLVLVMGWDADISDATKHVNKDLEDDTPTSAKGEAEDSLKEKKKIEDSKKTSPAAKKFLDKGKDKDK